MHYLISIDDQNSSLLLVFLLFFELLAIAVIFAMMLAMTLTTFGCKCQGIFILIHSIRFFPLFLMFGRPTNHHLIIPSAYLCCTNNDNAATIDNGL